jgi:hypothetical protein
LPNIGNTDIIGAFLFGTTCESLVHKLGRKGPRTTKELLDITTSHAAGEEAIGAIFDRSKGKVKHDENPVEDASHRSGKKKNKKTHRGSLVAAADRKGGRAPAGETPDHFEKLLEGPCLNHTFHVKHLYKDCTFMKRFLSGNSKKGEQRRKPELAARDAKGKDNSFPKPDGCLMILGGPVAYASKHR